MRFFLFMMFAIASSAICRGQQTDTIYFNSKWEKTDKVNKHFYRTVKKTSLHNYSVTDYYPDGKKQMSGSFSSMEPDVRDGDFTWWFEDGSKQRDAVFRSDTMVALKEWDRGGRLIKQHELVKTVVEKDSDAIHDFKVIEVAPKFPGGTSMLYKFISENLKYNEEDLDGVASHKAIVRFIVRKDGLISDVEVISGINKVIDREIIRLVRSMPKWEPGKQNGQFVNVAFNLPLTFNP